MEQATARPGTWEHVLERFGVSNDQELVERMMAELAGKSMKEQLRFVNITKVFKQPLLIPGGLIKNDDGSLDLVLKVNLDSLQEVGMVVGHEIAHAFLEKRGVGIMTDDFKRLVEDERDPVVEKEEDFCDLFGSCWVEVGDNLMKAVELHVSADVP